MAMSMQQLQIDLQVCSSKGHRDAMINLDLISIFEIETALRTLSFLAFEKVCHLRWGCWMVSLALGSVDPVAIQGAFRSLYFHMSLDQGHPVKPEHTVFGGELPFSLFWMPVCFGSPLGRFVWMASAAPLPEHLEQRGIPSRKTALGAH
jgi:hypothetical protein